MSHLYITTLNSISDIWCENTVCYWQVTTVCMIDLQLNKPVSLVASFSSGEAATFRFPFFLTFSATGIVAYLDCATTVKAGVVHLTTYIN